MEIVCEVVSQVLSFGALMSDSIPSHACTVICWNILDDCTTKFRAFGAHYTIEDSVFSSGQWHGVDVLREFGAGGAPSAGERSLSSSDDERGKEGDKEMPEEGSADPANVRGGLGTRFGSNVALARSCLSSNCVPSPKHSTCPREPRPDSDSPSDSSIVGELLPSSLNRESKYWANSSTAWLGFPLDSWGGGVETSGLVSALNCFSTVSISHFSPSVGLEQICGLRGVLGVLPGL